MTRNARFGEGVGGRVIAIVLVAVALVLGSAKLAHADNVDSLIGDLGADSDRVRLSAVLNLTKVGDARAIDPLIKTLTSDSDKKVRSAAAVGLGIIVTSTTAKGPKQKTIDALKKAIAGDASALVQAQAEKSLKQIGPGGGTTAPTSARNGIYVNIGPMSSRTGDATQDPRMRAMMVKVSGTTLTKTAPSMTSAWAGGVPTQNQLNAKGFAGFYVDGTLNELKVTTSGNTATVSCKVSMLLASFPDKSVFGMLSGGAKVQGSTSPKDIDFASEDCVTAVIENLIATKVVPTINQKVSNP